LPQFADEFTPEIESRADRLRRLLREPTRGIAPGVAASPSAPPQAVPRSQLPLWVQQRLREQEQAAPAPPSPRPTPTPLPRPVAPALPPPRAALLPGELPLEPQTRAERLRDILDRPVRGIAPGIAGTPTPPPQPRRIPVLDPFANDPFFDDQLTQDERAGFDRRAPSAFRALREQERLFEAGLEQDVNSSVGSESALERAKNLLRLGEAADAEEAAERPPLLEAPERVPGLLPTEILGVPVTVDRGRVLLAFNEMSGRAMTGAQHAALERVPEDERQLIDGIARELWIEEQGRELAEYREQVFGTPQHNPAFTDWERLFELATGQPHPDVGGIDTLARDLIRLRSGFDTIDDLTSTGRNGAILVYEPAISTPTERERINELLGREYPDERARFEAVRDEFPIVEFIVEGDGLGTALREGLESQGIVGDVAANFVDKALSPVTYLGPGGAASIISGGIASNVYEELRDAGLSPEQALGAGVAIENSKAVPATRSSTRGIAWAYLRERLGSRLDDFGDEWGLVLPPSPSETQGAGDELGGGGGRSFGPAGARDAGGGLGGGGGGSF